MTILNKVFWTMLLFLVAGCSGESPISFESESFNLEIKEWGKKATNNNASSYPPWNSRPGMIVGYVLWNDFEDLKVEYILHIRGARPQENLAIRFPIDTAPLLSSTLGLLCNKTNDNLDPIDIIRDNIIRSGKRIYAIAFAESKKGENFNWDDWFSIWTSVTIRAFTFESLSKGYIFEYESPFSEVYRNNIGVAMTDRSRSK